MAKTGVPGYCSICASPNAPAYVKGARDGWNAAQFNDYAAMNGEKWNRQTWYEHKKHAQTGTQLLITEAEKVRRNGALTVADIKKSSNDEFLSAVRDIGMARALANPEDVTIADALKSVSIMEGRKEKTSDSLNILVAFITGQPPIHVIEGTAVEVPEGVS